MQHNLMASDVDARQVEMLVPLAQPTHRLAYSNRTAWLLACLSDLAYYKFEPAVKASNRSRLAAEARALLNSDDSSRLLKWVDEVSHDSEAALDRLKGHLQVLGLELIQPFDKENTQAILVKNAKSRQLMLAFRGTEPDCFGDIKTDFKAQIVSDSGGKVHKGFNEAYNAVAELIEEELKNDSLRSWPLLLTGHSLGGALATIAAKKLKHEGGLAACYTYGAPRVGDADWQQSIQTPIYRIVNAADAVTMLPPKGDVISSLAFLLSLFGVPGKRAQAWFLRNFKGYMHCGFMRYLTNCPAGDYSSVKRLYAVSFLYRVKGLIWKSFGFKRFLADHDIRVYRRKLAVIAMRK